MQSTLAVANMTSLAVDLSAFLESAKIVLPSLNGWLLGYPVTYLFRNGSAEAAIRNLCKHSLHIYRIYLISRLSDAKNIRRGTVEKMAAEWSDENTRILTELFVQQVRAGNRPNTHLTSSAFEDVAKDFKTRTSLEYTKLQLKNKWDKLKAEYALWKKLKLKETGGGWDHERNTIKQDAEWWKKAKKDLPGCGKFQKHGIQNEDNLAFMFEDITSDGTDHWNPSSGSMPQSSIPAELGFNVDDIQNLDELDEVQDESPAAAKGKRLGKWVDDKPKKPKTAQVMQEQITKLGVIAERTQSSFESYIKSDDSLSVKSVMDLVVDCGALVGTDEYFIATELFVKREQREMFLHMAEGLARFEWLRRKYNVKYGAMCNPWEIFMQLQEQLLENIVKAM